MDNEMNECIEEKGQSYFRLRNRGHAHSERRRKADCEVKGWAEGSENEKNGNKCFIGHGA